MTNTDKARVFKAFCDENRLEIIELLKKKELCANDILKNVNVVQSTLSHHMKILCESGVVNARKSGKMTYYSISADGLNMASKLLLDFGGVKTVVKTEKVSVHEKKVNEKAYEEAKPASDEEDNWSKMVTFID